MLSYNNSERKFCRAPFFESVLLYDYHQILYFDALNISEDGLLLSYKNSYNNHFKAGSDLYSDDIYLMFCLTLYPEFILMDREKLFFLTKEDFMSRTYRIKAKVCRKNFINQEDGNKYLTSIASKNFKNYSSEFRQDICQYIAIFQQNIEFILMLFQEEENSKDLIVRLLQLLGYSIDKSAKHLRSIVLHDYNNLIKL